MATYWKIPFCSINDTKYEVRIEGAAGDDPITLFAADNPFETQEDDDRDMFKPVRTQTGYIRIVDTGKDADGNDFDWRDLIPSSAVERPVKLMIKSGASWIVQWQGFIRPETFSGTFREMPQEREFPVYCPFSALEAFDVNPADTSTTKNFAWLILYLLQTYYYISIGTFVFSRPQDVVGWLRCKFQWQNFFDEDGQPKYNALELLEEICKFWGWTARIAGNNFYFLQPDDTTAGDLGIMDLAEMDDVADGQAQSLTGESWNTASIATKDILARNNSEEYIEGVKNVSVKADINKSQDILNITFNKWIEDYRTNNVTPGGGPQYWNFLLYERIPTAQEGFFIEEMQNVWLTFQYSANGPSYGMMEVSELYDGDINDKHNYNLTGKVILHAPSQITPTATNFIFKVTTKAAYSPGAGVLVLNIRRVQIGWSEDMSAARRIAFAVKFGSQWWNPSTQTWGTTFAYLYEYLDPTEFDDNRVLDGPYMPYEHLGIPVTNQAGIIELYFYYTAQNSLGIGDIEISFAKTKTSDLPNDDTSNKYEEKNVAAFQKDVSIDTIFASDNNNKHGYGLIMSPTGNYASVVDYSTTGGNEPQHPEQHLVDRIADYGSSVKKVLVASLRNDVLPVVTPSSKITDENGTTYTPVSISREWQDNITNYTLMQL